MDDQVIGEDFMNRFFLELGWMNKKKVTTSVHHQSSFQQPTNYYGGGGTIRGSAANMGASAVAQAYNQTTFPKDDYDDDDRYYPVQKQEPVGSIGKLTGLKNGIYYRDGYINYSDNIGRANGGARFYQILFRSAGLKEIQGMGAFTSAKIKTIGVSFRTDLTIDKILFIIYGENRPNFSKMKDKGKKNLFENALLVLEEVKEAAPFVAETTGNFDGSFMKLLKKMEKQLGKELNDIGSNKQLTLA
jgi:hypothetical protein